MTLPVPASLESRIRKKWSRRAKLIGYGLLGGYLAFGVASIFLIKNGFWIYCLWTSGFAVALRYLRVARGLQREEEVMLVDDQTHELMKQYQQNVLREGQREVAQGSLAISEPESKGELSLSREGGALSPTKGGD